jgi:hypothetical protein
LLSAALLSLPAALLSLPAALKQWRMNFAAHHHQQDKNVHSTGQPIIASAATLE